MKYTPLNINIPQPCNENFAAMPVAEKGKLCGKCETIIYDFSQMTDAEMIRFFKTNPATHCGRFHNSQLNRNIEPITIRKKFLQKFVKIAASVIAILTLRNVPAMAQGEMRDNITQTPQQKNRITNVPQDFLIKGIVTDRDNIPLKNATVKFDNLQTTITDDNGNYSFALKDINAAHNIYFSCINYVTTVRTFNPVMGNTAFNVELGRRDTNAVVFNDHTAGVMMPINQLGALPSLNFKSKSLLFTRDIKDILAHIASQLKHNPFTNIEVKAYTVMHSNQANKIGLKRLELIKLFLVENQGISADRIFTFLEMGENIVDIVDISGN